MSKKRIQTLKTMDYNKVLADPFAYLNTLKGDQMAEDLDLDSLGKSKHSVTATNFMSSEIDIAKSIREVVDSRMRVPKDMRIDDGDLPMARNFFEWVTEDKFGLVNNEKPFIEQLCWAIIAFNEACFYCSDLEYLYDTHEVDDTYAKFERKVSLLEHGVCPSCKKGRADWLNKGEGKFIQELNISAGQRSGKSIAVGGWYAPYLTHRMLKLQNPSAFYNLKTGTMLHCTFVALTYVQAKDTLWQYFYATLTESNFFKQYHSMLKHYENRYGERLFKFNDTYVAYPTRGIMIYPAGPDKRVLRGRTRYFACIAGDQYVMTDSGLIPMEDVQDGMVAPIGSKSGTIRNHTMTGVKDVLKLTLNAGQELVASPEHKVVVYRKGKFKKVQMQNLRMSDKVCVGLGGKYPDSLELPNFNIPVCLYDVVIDLFLNYRGEIDQTVIKNFVAASGVATRGVSAILSKMRKSGAINKHYRKGKMFKGMDRCTYTLNCEETLLTYRTDTYGLKIPAEVTPEFGEFVGMLLADGNLKNSQQKGIWFCSTSKARVRRFHYLTYKLFGHKNHIVHVGSSERTGRAASWKSTLCNRHIIKFLRLVGLDDSYSADKVIPWSVLRAPRGAVLACLRAMYLCDGREHKKHIVYSTTSKKMASQIQQLVMREGIPLNMKVVRNYEACPIKYQEGRIIHLFQMGADTRYGKELADLVGYSIDRVGERRELFYEETKDKNIVTTTIYSITKERGKVKVYDMTVGHKRHAYQASGMLVANSVDEVGWFDSNKDSNKVKDNAHEVVGALDRSLLTVRGAAETLIKQGHHDVYPGYAMNVSSPSHRNDMINYLVRKSENSRSAYGAIRPTWEVNPTLPRDSAAIQAAFDEDPITAQRDYGAIPPLVSSPFLASESAIESVLIGKPNRIQIRRRISKSRKMGESYTVAKLAKVKRYRKPTIMTIDAGYSNNSFACCIGDIADDMTTAVVRGVFEVIPAAGAPLNHAIIYQELLLPLMERFNVKVLLADRWNSIKLLQDAAIHHDLEVSAQHSLKYAQIHTVKTRVQQGSLVLPEPERGSLAACLDFESDGYPECFEGQPASHLAMQMATVKDTGKTVDKGDGYTDDIFRAVALFCYACDVEDYQYALQDADDTEEDAQDRPTAFGVSSLLSGGGTVWGSGGSQASDGVGFMGAYLPGKQ